MILQTEEKAEREETDGLQNITSEQTRHKEQSRRKIKNCQTSTDRSKDTLGQTQAPQESHGTTGHITETQALSGCHSVTMTPAAPARLPPISPAAALCHCHRLSCLSALSLATHFERPWVKHAVFLFPVTTHPVITPCFLFPNPIFFLWSIYTLSSF